MRGRRRFQKEEEPGDEKIYLGRYCEGSTRTENDYFATDPAWNEHQYTTYIEGMTMKLSQLPLKFDTIG